VYDLGDSSGGVDGGVDGGVEWRIVGNGIMSNAQVTR
jgi:hypothetical protein